MSLSVNDCFHLQATYIQVLQTPFHQLSNQYQFQKNETHDPKKKNKVSYKPRLFIYKTSRQCSQPTECTVHLSSSGCYLRRKHDTISPYCSETPQAAQPCQQQKMSAHFEGFFSLLITLFGVVAQVWQDRWDWTSFLYMNLGYLNRKFFNITSIFQDRSPVLSFYTFSFLLSRINSNMKFINICTLRNKITNTSSLTRMILYAFHCYQNVQPDN